MWIKQVLSESYWTTGEKLIFFTRPHRFGKTLNMSMLKSFFEIGADKSLFDGLAISKDTALCDEYLGKYPVIFISFKDVDGLRFDNARSNLINKIGTEKERFSFFVGQQASLSKWKGQVQCIDIPWKGRVYNEWNNAFFKSESSVLPAL